MYRNAAVRAYVGDFKDRSLLFERITKDIRYFAELYLDLRTSYGHEALIFNKLLDQNQQYLLILSAMKREDTERDAKIDGIAAKFDQFHTTLRLLEEYESNSFQRLVHPLNRDIRGKSMAEIGPIFDALLLETMVEAEVLQAGQCATAAEVFEFERFRGVRTRWANFSKYVLMRIDHYETFEHYHATFYKHVEAQSVTPFAPRAMDRGLTGAFVSCLRLQDEAFNPNLGAEQLTTSANALAQAAKIALSDRAWHVTGKPLSKTNSDGMLADRIDRWVKEATRGGRRLGYDTEWKADDVVALLKKPGRDRWDHFTVPMSMREVEPGVNLIMESSKLEEGPKWAVRVKAGQEDEV
jgi:hypothetical protein